jgi:hypothetical protein
MAQVHSFPLAESSSLAPRGGNASPVFNILAGTEIEIPGPLAALSRPFDPDTVLSPSTYPAARARSGTFFYFFNKILNLRTRILKATHYTPFHYLLPVRCKHGGKMWPHLHRHAMTPVTNYPLTYYRSPEFVATFMRRADEDHESTLQCLQAIADHLREMVAAIRKVPPVPLTQFIAGPLTADHLIALIRAYAWHLLQRMS